MKQLGCLIAILILVNISMASAKQSPALLLMSDNAPPHVIEKSRSGIDIELTIAVLNMMDMSATVEFAPLSRGKRLVENKMADLFVPTFFQQDSDSIFVSDAIIEYRPTLFSLDQATSSFTHFAQIRNKKVATFQGATGYFGKEFEQMTKVNYYREVHDMSLLPKMLATGEVDIVFLDYYIFYYFLKEQLLTKKRDQIHINEQLLSNISAHVGFNNQQLRDQFNEALQQLKPATKNKIINHYIQ